MNLPANEMIDINNMINILIIMNKLDLIGSIRIEKRIKEEEEGCGLLLMNKKTKLYNFSKLSNTLFYRNRNSGDVSSLFVLEHQLFLSLYGWHKPKRPEFSLLSTLEKYLNSVGTNQLNINDLSITCYQRVFS